MSETNKKFNFKQSASEMQALFDKMENIDGAGAPDKTLTKEGVAADAKVTGEKIGELSEALETLEGKIPSEVGGMTAAQISALDGLFKAAAYTKDAKAEYAAFKTAFGIENGGEVEPDEPENPDEPETPTYTVTNNLTNVTNSNAQTEVTEGFYSATLTVADGFDLQSVVITMGGVDVTDSVYTAETGSILFTEVTGNIVVTATAIEPQYVGMRTKLYHDTLNLYSSADSTTKLRTINYVSGGAFSLCRTETDVNVIIRLTNNTDSDISDSSYAGCAKTYYGSTSNVSIYNAVLGTSATVRAGQTVEYTYTLKAGCYLYVFANNNLDVSVVGVLDVHEPVAEYELTTGYADAWNAYSDGTTDNKIGGGYYVTFTTTTEVFEEDTNLRITLLNGGTNMNYIGSAKQNAPATLFYAENGMSMPESGGMAVKYYTVKAGHVLSMGGNNIGYVYVEKA